MNSKHILLTGIATLALASSSFAVVYNGNGNTGFGGMVGNGSLDITDNGTNVNVVFTKAAGNLNDALVIYIDSVGGGFNNSSGFSDANDALRRAISGFDGGANRSLINFTNGFAPDYAIAFGVNGPNFGGLWALANGGNNSLPFQTSVNLSPNNNNNALTYTFNFSLASIGLTPGAGQTFKLFGTYISDTGFRSTEFILGNGSGTQGWNTFNQTSFVTYAPVPEPSTYALAGISGLAMLHLIRRRK